MKEACGTPVLVACLFAATASANAESRCAGSLEFTADGAITEWTTCHANLPQRFVGSGDERFRVMLQLNGTTSELEWHRTSDPGTAASYAAVNASGVLEIRLQYEQIHERSLVHTISIHNLSQKAALPEIRLRIGSAPGGGSGASLSLADLVYGFEQAEVEAASGSWQSAIVGSMSGRFAVTSRHRTLVVDSEQPFTVGTPGEWELEWKAMSLAPGGVWTLRQTISALPTEAVTLRAAGYGGLMYADLWPPLAALSRGVERFLAVFSSFTWSGPAIALVLLAAVIRLVTLPVSMWSTRRQREFAEAEQRMRPQIAAVKACYRGAEQSERILAIHRDNGISPFSGLKGSVGLFMQVPFLLAVFNVTTYSAIFAGQGFLWIPDLSQPDALAAIPVTVPLFGAQLNALPIALGIVNLLSIKTQQPGRAESGSMVTAVIIIVLTVLLLYSFAAAVVLYWLVVNLLQAGERILLARRESSRTGKQNEYQTV